MSALEIKGSLMDLIAEVKDERLLAELNLMVLHFIQTKKNNDFEDNLLEQDLNIVDKNNQNEKGENEEEKGVKKYNYIAPNDKELIAKYGSQIDLRVDLEKIKKEQSYIPPTTTEMSDLRAEIDLQDDMEEMLKILA